MSLTAATSSGAQQPPQQSPKGNFPAKVVSVVRPGEPSEKQLILLVGFIEQHGINASANLWSQITNEINDAGPLFHNAATWKTTFTEFRHGAVVKRRSQPRRLSKLEIRALTIPARLNGNIAQPVQLTKVQIPPAKKPERVSLLSPSVTAANAAKRRRSPTPPVVVRPESHLTQNANEKLDGILEMLSCANDLRSENLKVQKALLKIEERKIAISDRRMQLLEADVSRKAAMRAAFHKRWIAKSDGPSNKGNQKSVPTITRVQTHLKSNSGPSLSSAKAAPRDLFEEELDFLGKDLK